MYIHKENINMHYKTVTNLQPSAQARTRSVSVIKFCTRQK